MDIVRVAGAQALEARGIAMAGLLPASRRMTVAQLRIRSVERVALAGGRAFAMGLHPFIAWRLRPAMRARMVVGYVVAGYALVLAALLFF
ncbi:MAG TPA: hypothetical protein VH417_00055 [Vicinamibacterales bacterium]|jgi:hypothetical protein